MIYYVINLIFFFLPTSRGYGLKRLLLRLNGGKIGTNVRVMRIRVQGIKIEIGDNTFIGDEALIMGTTGTNVRIGKICDSSSRVNIITGTHKLGDIHQAAGQGYGEDIVIGDGVWVGFGATILTGIKIGNGSVIAAGSVVKDNVPEGVMVAGVPAVIKKYLYK